MFDRYEVVYLLSSLLGMFARYKFLQRFYDTKTRKIIDFTYYMIYYVVISVVYLGLNIPIVTLLTNIIFLVAIALSYKRSIKKAIFATLWTLGIIIAAELIVVMATDYIILPAQLVSRNNYDSIFGPIFTNLSYYIIVLIISKKGKTYNKRSLPLNYWMAVIIVPLSSLYFMLTLLSSVSSGGNEANQQVIIMSIMVLGINFSIFTIYDSLIEYYSKKAEMDMIDEQNKSYQAQLSMMKAIETKVYSFQHDMNKHIHSIRTLASSGENNRVLTYLEEINSTINSSNQFSSSGNLIIDSIINYEFSTIDKQSVDIVVDIPHLPEIIEVEDYDITIVLSNLLHNAFEAISHVKDNKKMEISIRFDKGMLMIKVSNTFDGTVLKSKDDFLSRKRKKNQQGYGLKNVSRVVHKYGGQHTIEHDNNIFKVNVLLYT